MVNFRTYELANVYFKECQKVRVAAFLRNQLDRAASSIVLNLAEGNGRRTTSDRKHFFQIAYGSLKSAKDKPDNVSYKFHIYLRCINQFLSLQVA